MASAKMYKCDQCPFSTKYDKNLKRHVKSAHEETQAISCELQKHKRQVHAENPTKKVGKITNYKCGRCNFSTKYNYNLKIHLNTVHERIHNYSCAKCDFKTSIKNNLKNHVRAVHDKICDFACEKCSYKTSLQAYLQKHVKAVHNNIRDHPCSLCTYKTSGSSTLKNLQIC